MRKQGGEAPNLPNSVAVPGTALVSAFDSAGVAVIITDFDLKPPGAVIRYVNPVFEEITGYAAEEVVGRSPRLLEGPLSDHEALPHLWQSLREGCDFRTETVNHRKSGEEYVVEWIISPIRDEHGAPTYWIALLRDVSHDRLLRQQFAAELEHRTRNLLATVRSIASRTLGETEAAATFAERLAALGRVQGLLSKAEKDEDEVDLDRLIRTELSAHSIPDDQVTIEGEAVPLPRSHIETLALVIHELATNARKHGALASEEGSVSIDWVVSDQHDRRLTLHWVESRATSMEGAPSHRGYGRDLIEKALPFSLRARTRLEFRPLGLWCRIDLPIPEASENSLPAPTRIAHLHPMLSRFRRDDGEEPRR